MTTFTTEDRIIAEKDGSYTLNVEGGTVTASPPHIVDSGASVMKDEPVAWIDPYDLERLPHYDCWVNGEKSKWGDVPLYTHPVKEQDTDCQYCKQGCIRCDARKQLTDEEILDLASYAGENPTKYDMIDFARAILRKAQEK